MPTKKSKRSSNEKKIDSEIELLKRRPLYPDLSEEKENMESPSSDDSPEKLPYRKSNSPSSLDSKRTVPGSPKRRSERHQQNQMNNSQDSENFDVDKESDDYMDMETDDTNYLYNRSKKTYEISPDSGLKKRLSPEAGTLENLRDVRQRILTRPQIPSKRAEPSTSTSSHSFLENNIYIILLCIFLFIICSFLFYMYGTKYPDTPYMSDHFNASKIVNSLKSKFKDQPPLSFRIIHSALRNVLEMQSTAPAIILLLATNGSENVCSEFAHSLVGSLPESAHTVTISGKEFKQKNAKMDIDKAISKALESHELGSVLIDELDQIPGQAATILYKYCDHENAHFKKAVFVMTINYNKAISDYSNTKTWDKAASDHLLSVWTDIGIDQVMPLLARLTVSVAVITARPA